MDHRCPFQACSSSFEAAWGCHTRPHNSRRAFKVGFGHSLSRSLSLSLAGPCWVCWRSLFQGSGGCAGMLSETFGVWGLHLGLTRKCPSRLCRRAAADPRSPHVFVRLRTRSATPLQPESTTQIPKSGPIYTCSLWPVWPGLEIIWEPKARARTYLVVASSAGAGSFRFGSR